MLVITIQKLSHCGEPNLLRYKSHCWSIWSIFSNIIRFFYHAFEFRHADEVVVFAVLFAAARGAGGMRNGNAYVGVVLQQARNQRGFAGAGCGGNNENITLHDERGLEWGFVSAVIIA